MALAPAAAKFTSRLVNPPKKASAPKQPSAFSPVVQDALPAALPQNFAPAAATRALPGRLPATFTPVQRALNNAKLRYNSNLAASNGSFTLPGVCDVAYGGNGRFKYLYRRTGTIVFTNTTFGGDPAPGVGKSGYYKMVDDGQAAPRPLPAVLPVNRSPVDRAVDNAKMIYNSNQEANTLRPNMDPEEYSQPLVDHTNNQSMSTENTNGEEQKGFFARHKKPLLIGAGVLLLGTATYLITRTSKKAKALPSGAPSGQGQKALAGLPSGKRKKARKTVGAKKKSKAPVRKAATKTKTRRGVKKVTLR
jgi:hypothetical protein